MRNNVGASTDAIRDAGEGPDVVNLRRTLRPAWSSILACTPGALLMTALSLSPLATWENGPGLQALYTWRGPRVPPRDVVIVSIDASSARDFGLPERLDRWPRPLHADLLEALADCHPRVIGFDVLFHSPREAADDARLVAAVRRAGRVALVEAVAREPVKDTRGRVLATVDSSIPPFPALAEVALATAPMVMPKSEDGVLEYWAHVPTLGDRPSLPVVMATAMGHPQAARVDDHRQLNFYGPIGSIATLRFSEALTIARDPQRGPATFGGKAVLVGLSEDNQSRQSDAYRTPFTTEDGVDLSGVELGATALSNLLDGSSLRRPSTAQRALGLFGWTLALGLPWTGRSTRRAAVLTALAWVLATAACLLAFSRHHLWLPVLLTLVWAPAITVGLGLLRHARQARERREALERAVDLGLSRDGLERLLSLLGPTRTGHTLQAVCLYADIEGYTRLSETLTPAQTRDRLDAHYRVFLPIVQRHGGYVADTVGDAILCLWPAHEGVEDASRRACQAALELHRRLHGEAGQAPEAGALPSRLGLHVGEVFLGTVGTGRHREIRAIGDLVNTTSRIQGCNKTLGTRVLATREVIEAARFEPARALGRFRLVGRSLPVELMQLAPRPGPREAEAAFAQGLDAYRAGDFAQAGARWSACADLQADQAGPCLVLMKYARSLTSQALLAWDGTVELRDK